MAKKHLDRNDWQSKSPFTPGMKEKEEAVVLEPHSRLIMASRPHRRPSSEGHIAAVLSSEHVGWVAAALWMGDTLTTREVCKCWHA